MDQIVTQIRTLAANAGDAARREMMASLHQLAYSMETPEDTLDRCSRLPLESATAIVGDDLGLFRYLTKHREAVSVEQLAQETGAEVQLLSRIMRYLGAVGAIKEVSSGYYTANRVTENLCEDVVSAGMKHSFHTIGPQYQALPNFLKRTGYQTPSDEFHTAFQDAWNTSVDAFTWFGDHPEHLNYFNDFMASRRKPEVSWLSVYPVEERLREWNPERPVYINIGGGIGHQCVEFRKAFPHVQGRVVLQDLPHTIQHSLTWPGVENMAHDFLEPQPIQGARFYFMRGVLHDHPAYLVQKVLEKTKEAMAPDSLLLVDEMILPDSQVSAHVAAIDMTMLTARGGMERTEQQWRQTFEEAGFELVKAYTYNLSSYEAIMEVRVAASAS